MSLAVQSQYALSPDGTAAPEIDKSGRIVDCLNPTLTRADTPEERVRQNYARILLEEYCYSRECMAIEALIRIGSEDKRADVVIYDSADACRARDQGRVALVVEAKAPTKKKGQKQLTSYVFASSAEGGVWTDGREVGYFRRVQSPGGSAHRLQEWTNIPRQGETWDTVGHYQKHQLRPPSNLKEVFQRCHNAIYRSGLDSEDVALDMVRIILAKYRDEQNAGSTCEFRCTPEEFATGKGRRRVGDRVHQLFQQVLTDHPDVFSEGEHITIGDDNLAIVVNELQPFQFLHDRDTEQVYDIIGTAFEIYVATHLKGDRGQYFTNRLVVEMMVEMLDPHEQDIVLDPACGSGGFLISALRYIRHKILNSDRTQSAKHREILVIQRRLFGLDVSPKLVRVAKTNMILNGDGHGGIVRANSLRDMRDELHPTSLLHPDSTALNRPTKIFTNPPFGASHNLRQRSADILANFELGRIWKQEEGREWLSATGALNEGEGVPPEILFLERCIQLLEPKGRLAIVIARGVLDNTNTSAARQYLLTHTRLLGVVNCHPNTFAPFNGTKAAVIFAEKKAVPVFQQDEDYPVFMAISQRVGQDSLGHEIHKRDMQGKPVLIDGRPVVDHDLREIVESWRQYLAGRPITYESAWSVPLSSIRQANTRLNPMRYAPAAELALAKVLEIADSDKWSVERLGDFANVFNGPRFKRPFADEGVMAGPTIRRMYTPKAFFERTVESEKYLDLARASTLQKRQLDVLSLRRDWILIVDSGTAGKLLGRVGMTTEEHEGAIGNNNLIRVVIDDPVKRDYTYQFLRSELGQELILRNVYGTNQDHVEPEDVKNIPIPIPRDDQKLHEIHETVRQVMEMRNKAIQLEAEARGHLDNILGIALAEAASVSDRGSEGDA